MQIELVTPPAIEPVTLAEAKLHCRSIDSNDEDTLIDSLITAARQFCEDYCSRSFINTTYRLTFDLADKATYKDFIRLPFGKIQSISNITSYDDNNNPTIFSTSNYRLSIDRVVLNNGYTWPTLERIFGSLEIEYIAGYGNTADDVPMIIRKAILMMVAHLYENRESLIDHVGGNMQLILMPMGVSALLSSYRTLFL